MINVIYQLRLHKLHPEQWVNVYHIDFMGEAIFHSSCQVKDLNLDDEEEYGLEPIDEDGNLMSVKDVVEAVREC
jgi:hypothetical protein